MPFKNYVETECKQNLKCKVFSCFFAGLLLSWTSHRFALFYWYVLLATGNIIIASESYCCWRPVILLSRASPGGGRRLFFVAAAVCLFFARWRRGEKGVSVIGANGNPKMRAGVFFLFQKLFLRNFYRVIYIIRKLHSGGGKKNAAA